jgi:hypothetical protein
LEQVEKGSQLRSDDSGTANSIAAVTMIDQPGGQREAPVDFYAITFIFWL